MPELPLTTQEAADLLGLKRTTLEAWRVRGCGPRFVKLGRAVRYRAADLDAWIESRTRTSTSEQKVA
jgi:excisionase family DNA binding protein